MTWRSSRQQTWFQVNLLLEIFLWYWSTLTELFGAVVNLQRWVVEALYQSTICIAVCHNFRSTICKLVIFLCLILYLYLVAIHLRTTYDLFTFHIKQTIVNNNANKKSATYSRNENFMPKTFFLHSCIEKTVVISHRNWRWPY